MKRLLLAVTALGLAGTIGTANATPDISNTVAIWNAATPGADANSQNQQALPSAILGGPTPLIQVLAPTSYVEPINYNLVGNTTSTFTIPDFFAASLSNPGQAAPATCTGACATNPISEGQGGPTGAAPFSWTSLFEFTFTPTSTELFTVTHDDGVSLFDAANAGTNLLPGQAAPTSSEVSQTITLTGGHTYDLWFTAANGVPEVLETNTVPVPTPLIGHGLLALLAVGGVLCGGKLLEQLKKRDLHAA